MKKIVITGALGHIGSALIRKLPDFFPGVEILMLDNFLVQRYASLFNLPNYGRYRFVEKDVSRHDISQELANADVVIHLAAFTNAAESFEIKDQLEKNNFFGTQNVAKACIFQKVPLIFVSTTSVYTPKGSVVLEDCGDDELQPSSPYSLTKLREEKLLQSLKKSDGLNFLIFRFGTIFGTSPGMRFHTAVNKFCWQAVMRQPITVWKTAMDQVRPYLDLNDAINAFRLVLGHKNFNGQIYNVLTGNFSVHTIIDSIRKYCPDLSVELVESKAMNELSYEVGTHKFKGLGFSIVGNLDSQIKSTIDLIKQAQSN